MSKVEPASCHLHNIMAVYGGQVVLSHTPFRSLAKSLGSKPVLVAGVGNVAEVAREYGFKHVLTTKDIALAVPKAVPFWKGSPGRLCKIYRADLFVASLAHNCYTR